MRTGIDQHAPTLARLLRTLHREAVCAQTGRTLVGDGMFLAIASHLVPQIAQRMPERGTGEAWRVRNAVAYIHAFLSDNLRIERIASAVATSPYYLNHAFRTAVGCSIWRYVLQGRALYAATLMRQQERTLTDIALVAGFATYLSFITAMRREFGMTPARLRGIGAIAEPSPGFHRQDRHDAPHCKNGGHSQYTIPIGKASLTLTRPAEPMHAP